MRRVPLAMRLANSKVDKIQQGLRSLSFRDQAIGGWASAQFSLDHPLAVDAPELDYFTRVYIYDTRSGQVAWEGRLEDPGRAANSSGEVWQLSAMGPAAHALDRTVPLIYVDRFLDRWQPGRTAAENQKADRRVDADNNGVPVLWNAAPNGTAWATNSVCTQIYAAIRNAGMKLGAYNAAGGCGKTTASIWKWQTATRSPGGTLTVNRSADFNTGGIAASQAEVVDTFPDGDDQLEFRFLQSAVATQTPGDDVWCTFTGVNVMCKLMDASGNELGAAYNYSDGTVTATEVVTDLLGRLLNSYDGPNAVVASTSYAIQQLAFPDGITPSAVIDNLMMLEPAYRWGAYESNSSNKYRFEFVAWPTNIRYEADITDGYDSQGSADGLWNAVQVRWTDINGQVQTTRRTSTVAALTLAGITRETLLDLGYDIGSLANAQQIGDQFLALHGVAANAGRLTVARPVHDLLTGQTVMPWQIKAGELIRVRGVLPRVDALNATTRDGTTVFRIWSREYDIGTAAATLELDSSFLTQARLVATLARQQITRRS